MKDSMRAHAAILAAVVLIAVGIILAIAAQPAQARDVEPEWTWQVAPSDVTNCKALRDMRLQQLREKLLAAWEEQKAEEAAEQQAWEEQQYYEPYYYEPAYYEPSYYAPSYVSGDPDGLNSFVGVVDGPNGTTETAYSSNVLYHYRTSEWTPDEYGFYRTDDGYYVVASNDYEEGTVIETSRGEAMVLDGGCDNGIVDFYTNW